MGNGKAMGFNIIKMEAGTRGHGKVINQMD
jgi:hypothetical protein